MLESETLELSSLHGLTLQRMKQKEKGIFSRLCQLISSWTISLPTTGGREVSSFISVHWI